MSAHESKFDESWVHERLIAVDRIPDPSSFQASPRVTAGAHQAKALAPATLALLEEQWKKMIADKTGLESYDALADCLRASARRKMQELSALAR